MRGPVGRCTTNSPICFDVLHPLPTLLTFFHYLCCSYHALYAEYHANPRVVAGILNLGVGRNALADQWSQMSLALESCAIPQIMSSRGECMPRNEVNERLFPMCAPSDRSVVCPYSPHTVPTDQSPALPLVLLPTVPTRRTLLARGLAVLKLELPS